jgi:hypothetical protein
VNEQLSRVHILYVTDMCAVFDLSARGVTSGKSRDLKFGVLLSELCGMQWTCSACGSAHTWYAAVAGTSETFTRYLESYVSGNWRLGGIS